MPNAPPMVRIEGVSKAYGSVTAIDDVSLMVEKGEIIALLGPSGCGKTTLLRMVANLVAPHRGDIYIGGKSMVGLPPHLGEAGLVFQSYALFPHLSVERNVSFGLEVRRRPKQEIAAVVSRMLDAVNLGQLAHRKPGQLSGGQQQRVALARALAISPKVLLLDEPFGALDKNLREEMEVEVAKIIREFEMTTIFVTHDQDEALIMADRIAVMDQGRVIQVAPGLDIYRRPATEFVAQFVGSANLLPGRVRAVNGGVSRSVVTDVGLTIPLAQSSPVSDGTGITVLVRPENIALECGPNRAQDAQGKVVFCVHYGSHTDFQVDAAGRRIKVRAAPSQIPIGEAVTMSVVEPRHCTIFSNGTAVP